MRKRSARFDRLDHESHQFRLYRPLRLARLLDVDASTIWRWRKSGVLPPPVEIAGIRGWTHAQIARLLGEAK